MHDFSTPPTTYTVTAANSSTQPYAVTVTVAPASTHTITTTTGSNGSISPSGSVSVNNGADQAFTITPSSGYHIDTVTADSGVVSATSPYTFTNVTADHTISATFAVDAVVVVSSGGGGGYIAPNVNITNFQSFPLYSAIKLTWTNPTDPSFLRALIVCSSTSTPVTASSGTLVYQGLATSFTDTNLLNNQTYYYSAFPYLNTGTSTTARASISGTPTGATTTTPTITTTTTQTPTPTVTPTTSSSSITLITANLSLGSTGPQVLALQQFLIDNGYLSTNTPTTYFGSLTQTALQKFQCDHSIICSGSPTSTGYGVTGPKTREAINMILSGGSSSNSTTSDDAHIATLRALLASLLQQVAVLQAKLAALKASVQTSTTTETISQTISQPLTDTFTFTRYLSLGMSGHDVEELQFFLNTRGFTIASSGPGSRGEETSYFGPATQNALNAYQQRYSLFADDLGYFGEQTRQAVNGEMVR